MNCNTSKKKAEVNFSYQFVLFLYHQRAKKSLYTQISPQFREINCIRTVVKRKKNRIRFKKKYQTLNYKLNTTIYQIKGFWNLFAQHVEIISEQILTKIIRKYIKKSNSFDLKFALIC